MDNQQSAELICQQIRDDAQHQVNSILQKAKQNAKLRIKLAQGEANRYLEGKKEDAKGKREKIRKRLLSTVGLETRRIITKAREEIINYVFEEVKNKGKNFRSQKGYSEWLGKIIIEGIINIRQSEVKVVVSTLESKIVDKEFVSTLKDELKKKHNLSVDIEMVTDSNSHDTGACIKSKDERIIFYNTFLARMERQRRQLRLIVFKEIFGDA